MPNSLVMGLLEKIETLLNNLLILIGNLFTRMLAKVIPPKMHDFFQKLSRWIMIAIVWCKNFPMLAIKTGPTLLKNLKAQLFSFNYRAKLDETYKAAMAQYKKSQPGNQISEFKTFFLAPFLMMGQWLKGLTSGQAVLLLAFTSASVLAGINMVFTGQRMVNHHMKELRGPASVEVEAEYNRPDYYKKQSRHLEISNLRLPVFFPNVNELRSIDIDFSATMSNRLSRMNLERLEFQLRDHLVLNVELMFAAFPLEEEGKEILRKKLTMEINEFMAANQIEGEVKDLKLIYILAN